MSKNPSLESLYQHLSTLSDDQFKSEYLNSLQWTEPIVQMLSGLDEEAQALRVVRLALEVDLKLGALLAGAVKPEFQNTTVNWVASVAGSQYLLIQLLGITGSDRAIPLLLQVFLDKENEENDFVLESAAKALAEIGTEGAVAALEKVLNTQQQEDDGVSDMAVIATEALQTIDTEVARQVLVEKMFQLLGKPDSIEYAASVLAKMNSPEVVPKLLDILKNDICDRSVRAKAAWVLGEIGSSEAVVGLLQALHDRSPEVSKSAARALAKIDSEAAVVGLGQALSDENESVRASAANALDEVGTEVVVAGEVPDIVSPPAIAALQSALNDEDSWVRLSAVTALGEIGSPAAVTALQQALSVSDAEVRVNAVKALEKIGTEVAVPGLIQALSDKNSAVRWAATEALGQIGTEAAMPGLRQALSDEDSWVRLSAARVLSKIGNEAGVAYLLQSLNDKNPQIRTQAASALSQIDAESSVTGLVSALRDEDSMVRMSAIAALGQIGSRETLPHLSKMLPQISDKDELEAIFHAISSIQKRWGYYA
ncbi:hypothetical protein NUACC21_35300 [Scytonema sp. NUACC21]